MTNDRDKLKPCGVRGRSQHVKFGGLVISVTSTVVLNKKNVRGKVWASAAGQIHTSRTQIRSDLSQLRIKCQFDRWEEFYGPFFASWLLFIFYFAHLASISDRSPFVFANFMQPMIFYHEITQAKKKLKNRHSRQHLGSKLPYMAISFCPF